MSSDATAVTNSKQPVGKTADEKGKRKAFTISTGAWIGIIGLILGMILTVLFIVWSLGATRGREFDASTGTFRKFSYVKNILTGKQFTGLVHDTDFKVDPTYSIYFAKGPICPKSPRWDLVEISQGSIRSRGPAMLLLNYFSAFDNDNSHFWSKWTGDHPTAAPVFWEAVRDCVHLQRYDRLPEVFEVGRSYSELNAFRSDIAQLMTEIATAEVLVQQAKQKQDDVANAQKVLDYYAKVLTQ